MSAVTIPSVGVGVLEPTNKRRHTIMGFGADDAGAHTMAKDIAKVTSGTVSQQYRVQELTNDDVIPLGGNGTHSDVKIFLRKTISGKTRKRTLKINNMLSTYTIDGATVNLAHADIVAIIASYFDPVWQQSGWTATGSVVVA